MAELDLGSLAAPGRGMRRAAATEAQLRRQSRALITLRNIGKSYKGFADETVEVLKGVSLTIETGSFCVIRGESGSGKTSLLRILGMLDTNYTGDYGFAGKPVNGQPDWYLDELRSSNVGFVLQDGRLLQHLNLRDNILLPVRLQGTPEQRSAADATVDELASNFFTAEELRLNILERRQAKVSGGQKQRASVMRAVINQPTLILADEPTASLDESRKQGILELLLALSAAGHTVVVVSHDKVFHGVGRQLELAGGVLRELSTTPTRKSEAPLPVRSPSPGRSILFGWRPRAPWSILVGQAAREAFTRPLFFALVVIALSVGVCQVSVLRSLIVGTQAFIDEAMTTGSRLNRLQITPRAGDRGTDQRFPVVDLVRGWDNVEAVVPRRQTAIRLANRDGGMTSFIAMGLQDADPEYRLLDLVAGAPFTAGADRLEIILTVGILNDLFDTTGLADGSLAYADFIGRTVTAHIPKYASNGDVLSLTPVNLAVKGIILFAEGGRQMYLPLVTSLVLDRYVLDRSVEARLPLTPEGDQWTATPAELAALADFPWEDRLHVYTTEIREIIPVFTQLSRLGYRVQSDIWDYRWALDIQDVAQTIFGPLLVLIVCTVALTVFTNILTSAKLREWELALWRILGMRRGDLVGSQLLATALMIAIGAGIGLLLGSWFIGLGRSILAPDPAAAGPGGQVENLDMIFAPIEDFAAFVLVGAVLVGVIAAIYPAMRAALTDPAKVLQQ